MRTVLRHQFREAISLGRNQIQQFVFGFFTHGKVKIKQLGGNCKENFDEWGTVWG